jgi:hypothetical protein
VAGVYADTVRNTGGVETIEISGDITGTSQVLGIVGSCTADDPLAQVTFSVTGHVLI